MRRGRGGVEKGEERWRGEEEMGGEEEIPMG